MKRVLVVEDERTILDIVAFNLQKEGYEVLTAMEGDEGLRMALEEDPDLILLDVMLPGLDGFTICQRVRQVKSVPILMLTAREEEVDKVMGLELGADDYITKPFSMKELMARVKANIRRSGYEAAGGVVAEEGSEEIIRRGELEIDGRRMEVRKAGQLLDITLREYELLRFLAAKPGTVFSREELMKDVWGYEYFGDVRTVDVTVRRLREKLEENPGAPRYILTKRGAGYYFCEE
ncbi:MAG: response regulator [Eubacteriales bacterium]|jgi:two-component system response regulator VicR